MLFMAFSGDTVIVANVSITVPCIATIMSRDVMERTNCKNSQDGAVYSIEMNLLLRPRSYNRRTDVQKRLVVIETLRNFFVYLDSTDLGHISV